jgi:hypothetical protein
MDTSSYFFGYMVAHQAHRWILQVIYDDELSINLIRRTYEYLAGFGPLINMGQLDCLWDVLLFENF